MTAMFRPPIAVTSAIGWPQVFGFGQGADPFFARVRAAQLAEVNRYVPFNVGLMMVNVVLLVVALRDHVAFDFLKAWGGVMGLLALLWSLRFRQVRKRGELKEVSRAMFWLISGEVAAFGIGWAVMTLKLLPQADAGGQMLLLLLSVSAMGACGFAAAVMPVCGMALVFSIGLGAVLAIPMGSLLASPSVVVAFLTYAVLICRGIEW